MYDCDRYVCGDHRWQTQWWVCQISLLQCRVCYGNTGLWTRCVQSLFGLWNTALLELLCFVWVCFYLLVSLCVSLFHSFLFCFLFLMLLFSWTVFTETRHVKIVCSLCLVIMLKKKKTDMNFQEKNVGWLWLLVCSPCLSNGFSGILLFSLFV